MIFMIEIYFVALCLVRTFFMVDASLLADG
jgi:hypothetical protein